MTTNRVPGGVSVLGGCAHPGRQANACLTAPGDTLLSAVTEAASTELGQPARVVSSWQTGADVFTLHFEAVAS